MTTTNQNTATTVAQTPEMINGVHLVKRNFKGEKICHSKKTFTSFAEASALIDKFGQYNPYGSAMSNIIASHSFLESTYWFAEPVLYRSKKGLLNLFN